MKRHIVIIDIFIILLGLVFMRFAGIILIVSGIIDLLWERKNVKIHAE